MPDTFNKRVVISGVVALLADNQARPVGDGESPPGDDSRFPYLKVYSINGGMFHGGLKSHDNIVDVVVQIDGVAKRRDQADWMGDVARDIMIGRDPSGGRKFPFVIAGADLIGVIPEEGPGGVQMSGRQSHRLFTASERYLVTLTPT